MKLSIIVVLAALAVANAGSVDVKLQDKKITITPKAADAWQSLISPLTTKETLPVDVPVLPVSSTLVSSLKSAADTGCYVDPSQGCSGMCAGGYCGATSAGACACWPTSLRRRTTPPPPPSKCDAQKKLCKSDSDCEKAPSGCKTCRDDGPILNPPLQCKYLMPGDCYCQTAPGPSPGPSPTGCYIDPSQGCSGTCAGGYCQPTSAGACACYPGRAAPAFMN